MPNMRDPVCGRELTAGQVEAQSRYEGKVYSFCSAECKQLFDKTPKDYVGGQYDQPQDAAHPITQ